MLDEVVLVDEKDFQIGTEEKLKAHIAGKLHRAFSIFIFNQKGELLLQKRASSKYHSPDLWTNTCCSHPRPNEDINFAVHRRLKEEMGFDCKLKEVFSFIYKEKVKDLVEHEFDHVYIGYYENEPIPNKEEAGDYKWMKLDDIKKDIAENPEKYTPWFKIILNKYLSNLKS